MSRARLIGEYGVLLGVALFAGMALFGINNDPSELPSALIGKPFPEFSSRSLDDPEVVITRADLLGRPALINVWATWCVSCKVEHPVLNDYGFNFNDIYCVALRVLSDFLNPYQLYISVPKGTLGFDLGVFGAPETFMLDKRGVIRHKFVGVIDKRIWRERLAPMYQELLDE